jgi:hypothetical protein
MTLVEHHESKSEWWTVKGDGFTASLQRAFVLVNETCPPDSLCNDRTMSISLKRWLAYRDAIDALYKVWSEMACTDADSGTQEQQPCQ